MKPIEGEDVETLECPVCNERTAKEKVEPASCIQELMKCVSKAKEDGIQCDQCHEHAPKWRCHECKENFCDPCQKGHNSYSFMRHHKCEKLSENVNVLIDKHVYCQRHPQELVKLHCKDCKTLICFLCNGTGHKSHDAETIDEAVQNILPVLKESTIQFEDTVNENEKALEDSTVKGEALKKTFEEMEKAIDQKCEEIIRKVREDCKQVKQQLKDVKEEECGKIEAYRKHLEVKIQSQKNVVVIKTTTAECTQGTSLLQIAEWGSVDDGGTGIQKSEKVDKYFSNFKVGFIEASEVELNQIGKVSSKAIHSDWINRSLQNMRERNPELVSEIKSIHYCPKFVKLGDELFCCKENTNTLDIYSIGGNKLRSVTFAQVGHIQSVITMDKNLVLATKLGLFIVGSNGTVEYKVIDRDIIDVSAIDDTLFVLDNGASKIHILKLNNDGKSHVKQGEFVMDNYVKSAYSTIQATRKCVYVAKYAAHRIVVFDHLGVLQATHTACDADIGTQLSYPKICGIDLDDNILICRYSGDHKLVLLTSGGQWQALPVAGIISPHGAFVENDQLWVYEWNNATCKQFRFN